MDYFIYPFAIKEENYKKYVSNLIKNKNYQIKFFDSFKNIELFKRITNFVLKSNSRIFSSRSIEGYLKNEHIDGSINTIIKYLGYLEEAYIIDRIKPYSSKKRVAWCVSLLSALLYVKTFLFILHLPPVIINYSRLFTAPINIGRFVELSTIINTNGLFKITSLPSGTSSHLSTISTFVAAPALVPFLANAWRIGATLAKAM